jgi:hypothetical protein
MNLSSRPPHRVALVLSLAAAALTAQPGIIEAGVLGTPGATSIGGMEVWASPAGANVESGASLQLAKAMEMRSALGFRDDAGLVSDLLASPETIYEYGGPLSIAENDLMRQRVALEQASTELIAYIDLHDDDFGGVWFEHPSGGELMVITVTSQVTSDWLSKLEGLRPAALEVVYREVPYSLATLRTVQRSLFGREAGLGITGSYVDVKGNALVVGGSEATAANLSVEYGIPVRAESIQLEPVACGSRSACTPYRSGTFMDFPNQICTWGWMAKTNLVSQLNLVSAGHCATLGQWAKHNGTTVTTSAGVNRNTYDLLGDQEADALRAPLTVSGNLVAPYNVTYVQDGETARVISAKEGTATQAVGETACFAGRTSGNVCGSIEAIGFTGGWAARFDGRLQFFYNLIRINRTAAGGDSGAPVRYGFTALGVVGFKDSSHSNHMVYGGIDKVESALNVQICLTSSCGL